MGIESEEGGEANRVVEKMKRLAAVKASFEIWWNIRLFDLAVMVIKSCLSRWIFCLLDPFDRQIYSKK